MNEKDFLEEIEEILNLEEAVTMETELKNLEEWDSLVALMFQSFVYKKTGKAPVASDIASAKTIKDLYEFVK